jgi:outer membrane protein OmpA-like peptidoglycan-associated protein/tetratricopeptide (TPR) repeat protein
MLLSVTLLPDNSGQVVNSSGNSRHNLKSNAIRCYRRNDPYNSIVWYERYLASGAEGDLKNWFRLANLYYEVRDYAHADQYYDSVLVSKRNKYIMAGYYKGLVSMNLEKYDEAVRSFSSFRNTFKRKDPHNYRKLALVYIESSNTALSNNDKDPNVVISLPGSGLNPAGLARNEALTDDGKEMFFTKTEKNWKNQEISAIYQCKRVNGTWSVPVKLPWPVNDANYTSTQPATASNPKNGNLVLYFVSNRREGRGGLDIWYTEFNRKSGSWNQPANAGRDVNSAADECSPFYENGSHTLYYSSKGRPKGLGGYDIYKTTGAGKKWTDALPLPRPINSSFDDYYYSIRRNNREGNFRSNRPGSMALANRECCDDMYQFEIRECKNIQASGTVRNSLDYAYVRELTTRYPVKLSFSEDSVVLPDVVVALYMKNDSTGEQMVSEAITDENGNFGFNLDKDRQYEILVKNYGYFEKRIPVSTSGLNCSDTINLGITSISYLPGTSIIVNIYYEHNRYKLSDSAITTIDKGILPLFDLFPSAVLEIGSHTDNTGTDAYNLKLSQRRSESVVSYLISKGIPETRMVARGYGWRSPVAPNTNRDGSDNPAGRQLNRRTEIRIVGETGTMNSTE